MNINKPIGQHDLPKTYLRRFAIDTKRKDLKNMVYCFWENQYGIKIERTSVDSNKFKKNDFYTIDHDTEPYFFETFFSEHVEPLYTDIINEIESEKDLSKECRQYLIVWLYYNKFRNEATRNNFEGLANFLIETPYLMEHGKESFEPLRKETELFASKTAKDLQFRTLITEDFLYKFDRVVGTKHWMILKSRVSNTFFTNDNPGFSINMNIGIPDMNSLNKFYSATSDAWNYFVLSPNYCLLISPFWEGTPLETSIHNQVIEFKTINKNHIDFINRCTKHTRTKYLIAKDKDLIERHVR